MVLTCSERPFGPGPTSTVTASPRTLSDEGISGSNAWEIRKALPEALRAAQEGRAQGIVVHRLGRLARDLIAQELLLREVRRLGGEVFSTSAGEAGYLTDNPDDPSRTLIRQILGAVSEYERNSGRSSSQG